MKTRTTGAIEEMIRPTLAALGHELVRVMVSGSQRPTLQVMIERVDRRPVSVDDCAEVSHAVSALLDVEEPVVGTYVLEVSSPGIDRPLTRPQDFERFSGYEVKVEMRGLVDGRRRFTGQLAGIEDGTILVDTETGRVRLMFADVAKARLVLNDALLAEAARAVVPDVDGVE